MIDEISSLNRKIAVLKDEFIAIQNDLNSLYWPRLAKIKKKMKDYLQKAAGSKMRGMLTAMTSNPFKGVLTGLGITTEIGRASCRERV